MGGSNREGLRIGWIGVGRMGYELASRLLRAGCDVAVRTGTRPRAEPLADLGATIADSPSELADCDVVFTMVAGPDDFKAVTIEDGGVLSADGVAPRVLVDSSTVSAEASEAVRAHAAERGTAVLAAPVSGNPKVVKAGRLTVVASGPEEAFEIARPYLELFGEGVTYVGEGDSARLVKLCHNLMLGIVAPTLAEITVLAAKGGGARGGERPAGLHVHYELLGALWREAVVLHEEVGELVYRAERLLGGRVELEVHAEEQRVDRVADRVLLGRVQLGAGQVVHRLHHAAVCLCAL